MADDKFTVEVTVHVFIESGKRFARMRGVLEIPNNPVPDAITVRLGEKRITSPLRPLTYDLRKGIYSLEIPDQQVTFDESTRLNKLEGWDFKESE